MEPRTRKFVKGYVLLSFVRKYKRQLMDIWPGGVRSASKKVVYKAGEFLEILNKLRKVLQKWNTVKYLNC